jgi:hypothetical protein|tara:strand:- start:615 stop:806 length:192 start_codon:yes stop_codon:yes gene_type:complete
MDYSIIDRDGLKLFTHTTGENIYMEGPAVLDESGNLDTSATEIKIQSIIDDIATHPDRSSWGL